MEKSNKIFLFFLVTIIFVSCHTPIKLGDTAWVQKRKYTKGYYFSPFLWNTKVLQKSKSSLCQSDKAFNTLNKCSESAAVSNCTEKVNSVSFQPNSIEETVDNEPKTLNKKIAEIKKKLSVLNTIPCDTIIPNTKSPNKIYTPKYNKIAVLSFILSVLSVLSVFSSSLLYTLGIGFLTSYIFLLFIPGFILGIIAFNQIKKHPEKGGGKFFSISSIVIGITVLISLILLILLLIYAFSA